MGDFFENGNSPWPLPKLVYAYVAYVYTKNWASVLLSFYLFRVLYVFLFYLDQCQNVEAFDGMGNFDAYRDRYSLHAHPAYGMNLSDWWSIFADSASPFYKRRPSFCDGEWGGEPNLVSVMVGDFVWAVMGIVLGWFQTFSSDYNFFPFYTFKGYPFYSSEEWKRKYDADRLHAERAKDDDYLDYLHTKNAFSPVVEDGVGGGGGSTVLGSGREVDENDEDEVWYKRYGIWPPLYVFGCDDWWCCCCCCDNKYADEKDAKRWVHRRFFWFYLIQLVLMGTPATIVFTVNEHQDIRSGVIVYYVMQSVLWFAFYHWNKYYHDLYGRKKVPPSSYRRPSTIKKKKKDVDFFAAEDTEEEFPLIKRDEWSRFDFAYAVTWFTLTVFCLVVAFKAISPNVGYSVLWIWLMFITLWLVTYAAYYIVDYFYPALTRYWPLQTLWKALSLNP